MKSDLAGPNVSRVDSSALLEDAVIADGGEIKRSRAHDGPKEQLKMEVRDLIEEIAKALVDNPDEVEVVEIVGTQSCVLELHVHPSDVGKVIGKRGVHADAIRRLVHAIGGKRKRRYVLEIIEGRPE
jgi:predicted RNA-binding protein YlqC (UPF0109 family)